MLWELLLIGILCVFAYYWIFLRLCVCVCVLCDCITIIYFVFRIQIWLNISFWNFDIWFIIFYVMCGFRWEIHITGNCVSCCRCIVWYLITIICKNLHKGLLFIIAHAATAMEYYIFWLSTYQWINQIWISVQRQKVMHGREQKWKFFWLIST